MTNESIDKYLCRQWPPTTAVTEGNIVYRMQLDKNRKPVKRYSNKWTQYLEWLLMEYVRPKEGIHLLREVPCQQNPSQQNPNRKLDYMLVNKDPKDFYFSNANVQPKNMPWTALIEAQWDQNEHEKDFMPNDLQKLIEWKGSSSKGQCKIAICNVRVPRNEDPEDIHKDVMAAVKGAVEKKKDFKSKYCLIITSRLGRNKQVICSCFLKKANSNKWEPKSKTKTILDPKC